jgi:predicted PurR-regulated permease PerM
VLVFAVGLGLVMSLLSLIVPRLILETRQLISDTPRYTQELQSNLNKWLDSVRRKTSILKGWKLFSPPTTATNTAFPVAQTNLAAASTPSNEGATNLVVAAPVEASPESQWEAEITHYFFSWLKDAMPAIGKWLLSQLSRVASWGSMFIGLAMVPVFIFYFLDEKSGIQKGWTNYLPIQESKFKYELVFCLNAIKDYLIVFFRGQILVAMCLGVLYSIGFSVVNLNYALLLGTLAGMLSIVPYLGAILTIVPAVILAAVQHNDWKHPILVVIVFAVVQSLEGLLISPKIMGDRVGLHPFTIIVAVLVGTTLLGGILGGLLAIPLTAALRVLMFRYVWRKPGEVVSKS